MATVYNPQIVTNGLVLCLDAANPKSYPGSGVTWGDLVNTNNATLLNGPSYSTSNGGSFSFDGVDDYAQYTGSFSVTQATFICWIKRNGTFNPYDGILYSRSTNTTGMGTAPTQDQLGYTWNNAVNTYSWSSGLTIPSSIWCMVAISVAPTFATAYVNLSSATNSVSHSSTVIDDICIGRDEFSNRNPPANIAVAQLYNRALSSDEIRQNYNALRGRFGV